LKGDNFHSLQRVRTSPAGVEKIGGRGEGLEKGDCVESASTLKNE